MELTPKHPYGSPAWLDEIFTYHPADEKQKLAYEKVRASAKQLVNQIIEWSPRCADQSAAIRCVREAVMTANAAIALHGLV